MPTDSYLPDNDAALADWLGNFIQVANANLETLHLTAAALQPVTLETTVFNNDTAAIATARQTAKVATKARHMSRKAVVGDARALVKSIQALTDVPDTLKIDLRITVSAGRRPEVPVFQPMLLTATVQADMTIRLKWDKNGNHYGCSYIIERKCGAETAWTQIEKITASRFVDGGCAAGVQATYRVTATRGHLTSLPSALAIVTWQ